VCCLLALSFNAACGGADDLIGDSGNDVTGDGDAFTGIYNSSDFQKCSGCHAPGAPGRVEGIEATQNWSTRDKAYAALMGKASGLIGNFAGCNGVPFIGATADESLLVAVFDEQVRESFMVASTPDCTGDAISDMTLKIGNPLPDDLLNQLKAWINDGAPD
jgi:hypothetical protein